MKKIISSEQAPKAIGPYSQAVEANGTLYISGQLPIDPATGQFVQGGIAEHTEQILNNIGNILKAAGYNYSNVVKSTVFLVDLTSFKAMNEVYSKFYPTESPARSTVQVAALPMGAQIEIEIIAVK